METALTKEIKRCTHFWKPKMSIGDVGRTIRYADEVWTPNGIVDSIRFEDYEEDCYRECKRINFEPYLRTNDPQICNLPPNSLPLGNCKIKGNNFPCKDCKGCFYHVKRVNRIGMMITAFEVKITKADFLSKNGHNIDDPTSAIANENYYCVPRELVNDIKSFVPKHVGILSYSGKRFRCVKKPVWQEVDDKTKILLLYNAMKKWCDGKMEVNTEGDLKEG